MQHHKQDEHIMAEIAMTDPTTGAETIAMKPPATETKEDDNTYDNNGPIEYAEEDQVKMIRFEDHLTEEELTRLYSGSRREVFCSTNVTLLSVKLDEQLFFVEMDIRFFWQQPEIAEEIPQKHVWKIHDDGKSLPIDPDDLFEHDGGVEWIQRNFTFHKNGVVEWQCQFRDSFAERMELQRFPIDRQFLNMKLQGRVGKEQGNWKWVVTPPEWVPSLGRNSCLSSRLGQSISDYDMFSPWADFRVVHDKNQSDNVDDEQPPFKLRLRVQRYPGYYVANIVVPLFLIVLLCGVSLVLDPDKNSLGDRLSVTVTAVLAGVAFQFVVSNLLPPVNYVTLMDLYVGFGFLTTFLFVFENGLAAFMHEKNNSGGTVDFWFGGGLVVVWLVVNACLVAACYTDTFRLSWDQMDLRDRQPNTVDEYKQSTAQDTRGEKARQEKSQDAIQKELHDLIIMNRSISDE